MLISVSNNTIPTPVFYSRVMGYNNMSTYKMEVIVLKKGRVSHRYDGLVPGLNAKMVCYSIRWSTNK